MKKIVSILICFILLSEATWGQFDPNRNFHIDTKNISTKSNIIYKREELINASVSINAMNELTNSLNLCNQARIEEQKNNNEILKLLIGKVK